MKKLSRVFVDILFLANVAFLLTPAFAAAATCPNLTRNLSLGMSGNDVSQLQQFLAADPSVYPEGLVTGYFGARTAAAVRLFQVKYALVTGGTSVPASSVTVGPLTRAKIASLCGAGTNTSAAQPMQTATVTTPAPSSVSTQTQSNGSAATPSVTSSPAAPAGITVNLAASGQTQVSVVIGQGATVVAPESSVLSVVSNSNAAVATAQATGNYLRITSLTAGNTVMVVQAGAGSTYTVNVNVSALPGAGGGQSSAYNFLQKALYDSRTHSLPFPASWMMQYYGKVTLNTNSSIMVKGPTNITLPASDLVCSQVTSSLTQCYVTPNLPCTHADPNSRWGTGLSWSDTTPGCYEIAPGSYTLTIPDGLFTDSTGHQVPGTSYTFDSRGTP